MELPKIISVDDHVIEPPHVWSTWLPRKYAAAGPRIWSVADLGEPGRIVAAESDADLNREEVYQEIVKNVDQLVSTLLSA